MNNSYIYRTNGSVESELNMLYHVFYTPSLGSGAQLRIHYYGYNATHGGKPTINIILYNGTMNPISSDWGATSTLERTEYINGNTLNYYKITPDTSSSTLGLYNVSLNTGITKVMVEDVDGCTPIVSLGNRIASFGDYILKESLLVHASKNSFNFDNYTGNKYNHDYDIYWDGVPSYNRIDVSGFSIKGGLSISDLKGILPHSCCFFLSDSGLTGNIEDIADYINIYDYKTENGNLHAIRFIASRTNVYGDYNILADKLVERGARNFALLIALSGTNVLNMPETLSMIHIDANGNINKLTTQAQFIALCQN